MKRFAIALVLLASCGTPARAPSTPSPAVPKSTPSTGPTSATAAPTVTSTPARSTTAPSPPGVVVHGAGSALQAIVVRSRSWDTSVATLQAFEKRDGAWHTVVSATQAFVGINGFASGKREGDGRTPAGVYGFSLMFGTAADPGVAYTYRQATPQDVWVDDPSSSLYNTWQREPSDGRWTSAEKLYQPDAYRYAAVIAYNTSRTPGKGSAIFMHVSLGHGTAGCVAIDQPTLLRLLRWLQPSRRPVIVMGPDSYVDRL